MLKRLTTSWEKLWGRAYVDKYFPPAAKTRVQEMVGNILLAMQDTINGLEWMSAATRATGAGKIIHVQPKNRLPGQVERLSRRRGQQGFLAGRLPGGCTLERG